MSHFATIATRIKDLSCLQAALTDLGLNDFTSHKEPVQIIDYYGNLDKKAHLVLTYPGAMAQLGFLRNGEHYDVIEDKYETDRYLGRNFINEKLMPKYLRHVAIKQAGPNFTVEESVLQDGKLRLRLIAKSPEVQQGRR